MHKELAMVKAFHEKFKVPVLATPSLVSGDRSDFRHALMAGEVDEYLAGVQDEDLANVAKELADVLYAVYGTVLEHGLQEKMEEVFEEVHRSNMSKDYAEYKMVKGKEYHKADIEKVLCS